MIDLTSSNSVRESLESQVAELKKELGRISKSVQSGTNDAVDSTQNTLDSLKSYANGAAKTLGQQARVVSEVASENPGTATAMLSSAGVVGLLIGLGAGYLLAHGGRR